ncbi:abhydrolase domain-containing 18 [Filobacillus milosensis]|uniref:Abhydrolase domain-containing 18 n=1 Tax=Filobacillus milosensis TaxID=94137 RepID=A0A4Y8IR75_9BACI|nr:alpha/beta fold hydrolase [Filobacillus milosensis]TFB24311.1 abhydrolase domain-containing 18 [Filobacillus milosensis]
MQIKQPQPFTFEAGDRAVLLLHGFTGHSADVRMLGRYLEKKGYTSHAPIYKGHGEPPEELVKSNAKDWWKDALDGYNHLKDKGYDEIAVAGLSLGGVLALRLAYEKPVKGVVPICSPMFFDNVEELTQGFRQFAKEYKQLEKKEEDQIKQEIDDIMENSEETFETLSDLIKEVHDQVDHIYAPTLVLQAEEDEMINKDSANYIYDNVEADEKDIKWYEGAPHVITLSDYKEKVHEDVYNFLESLDWSK